MNASRLFAIVVATASLVGCTANTTEPTSEEVANSAQALTLAQCATQRDTCFSANPLFGLLTCPAQYAQCTLTASNGLPAEVSAAIADTTQCAATGVDCVAAASTPAQLLDCTAAEAACVANVVDVHLPSVVQGTASCVDTSVSCIKAAKTAADLTACANALEVVRGDAGGDRAAAASWHGHRTGHDLRDDPQFLHRGCPDAVRPHRVYDRWRFVRGRYPRRDHPDRARCGRGALHRDRGQLRARFEDRERRDCLRDHAHLLRDDRGRFHAGFDLRAEVDGLRG